MLSREQAQALAHLIHLLRPAWNVEGIYAALGRGHCRDHDAIEVCLAALRATGDRNVQTPGVIPASGPHWNELQPTAPGRPHIPRAERRVRTPEPRVATSTALDVITRSCRSTRRRRDGRRPGAGRTRPGDRRLM